jgi:hypothetical protein
MRYDRGYRGYDRGWAGGGRMGGMPRYDETFRAGRGGYDAGFRGQAGSPRGYDLGYGPHAPWHTAYGMAAHPSDNQQVDAGETDFLGRPYPSAAQEDVPWGLIGQERVQRQTRSGRGLLSTRDHGGPRGYDRGMMQGGRGYDRGMMQGGRGYDRGPAQGYRGGETMQGPGGGGYGGARGAGPVAGMRYGGSYGGGWGYDNEMRPESFHARNLPDSDEAGVDLHRMNRGRDLRYTSSWTRWF